MELKIETEFGIKNANFVQDIDGGYTGELDVGIRGNIFAQGNDLHDCISNLQNAAFDIWMHLNELKTERSEGK